jgi:peptide deformylase
MIEKFYQLSRIFKTKVRIYIYFKIAKTKIIMNKFLEIAQLGNPILRQQALPVDNFIKLNFVEFIDRAIATVMEAKGVGIAAPQLFRSQRLFILASHPNERYPHAPKMSPTAIINPQIIGHNDETQKDWEGCLSLPGIRGLVPRYTKIEVEYTTRDGKLERKIFTDFIARVFQHELDHLDGLVFLDRIETTKDLYSEAEYHKIVKQ